MAVPAGTEIGWASKLLREDAQNAAFQPLSLILALTATISVSATGCGNVASELLSVDCRHLLLYHSAGQVK